MKTIINLSFFLCFAFSLYGQTYKKAPKTKRVAGVEIDSVQTLSGLNLGDTQHGFLYDLYTGIIKVNNKKRICQIYNFKEGKIDGKQIQFDESGYYFDENYYENGLYTKKISYFSNGQINCIEKYKNGLIDGEIINYDRKGRLVYKRNYDMGRSVGEFKSYFSNGELCCIGSYKNYLKSGKWLFYGLPRGSIRYLRQEENYVNGLKEGKWLTYHSNGNIATEINYLNDSLSGNSFSFKENGQKIEESFYKNGFLEGKYTSYYSNGKLKKIGQFVKGYYSGDWNFYHENGEFHMTLTYNQKGHIIDCKGDCDRAMFLQIQSNLNRED